MSNILKHSNVANRPRRFLVFAALLLFIIFYLWSTSAKVPFLKSSLVHQSAAEIEYQEQVVTDLNITQWGVMGENMRLLSKWAQHVVEYPRDDTMRFEATLMLQFPFLSGTEHTVYRPWIRTNSAPATLSTGFVICVGSQNFHLAAHLIINLRHIHNISLPIEVAYGGEEDLHPKHRTFLQELASDITFIDLYEAFPNAHHDLGAAGWAMKPFALLASSHPRAILLDADAVFFESPEDIFESNPGLARTGTLFFHDRAAQGATTERLDFIRAQIQATGRQPSDYLQNDSLFYSGAAWYEADSGLVAIDKSRADVLLGLIWATWMNTKEIREEISYRIFYGDKETFWVAMELSGVEYFFQPWYAGTMGTVDENGRDKSDLELEHEAYEICGTHMLHLTHNGKTPFWINGGIYENKNYLDRGYMQMTHYWVGTTQSIRDRRPDWYWHGSAGCLMQEHIRNIPQSTSETIAKMIAEAKKIDPLSRAVG